MGTLLFLRVCCKVRTYMKPHRGDDEFEKETEGLFEESYKVSDAVLDVIDEHDFRHHAEVLGLFMAAVSTQVGGMLQMPPEMIERFASSGAIELYAGEAVQFIYDEVGAWIKREIEKC